MPLTGALKEWVAKLKAYQHKHGVSYKAAMSALKGKGRSHRGGGGGEGVAANAEAFTPQGDSSHPPPATAATPPPHSGSNAQTEIAGFEMKALPQSGGGLSDFEVGATNNQAGGRRRRGRSSKRGRGRSSKRGRGRSSKRGRGRGRSSRRNQQRNQRGGSHGSLSYSDYA